MTWPIKGNNLKYLKENVEKYYTVLTSKAVGVEAFRNRNKNVFLRGNLDKPFPFFWRYNKYIDI